MGTRPEPHMTIERKDNDLGYSKANCVWATRTAQMRNRRSVVLSEALALEVKQVKACGGNIAEWARNHGVSREVASLAANGTTWKGL